MLIGLVVRCEPPNRKTTGKLFNNKKSNVSIPSLDMLSMDGKTINLKDRISSNNKLKLVSFWATWCGPCNIEYNEFKTVYQEWKKKYNFEIISISIDKQKMYPLLPDYIEQKKWPFEFYYDKDQIISKNLKIPNIPFSYLVNAKGEIVHIEQEYHEAVLVELEAMLKALYHSSQIKND